MSSEPPLDYQAPVYPPAVSNPQREKIAWMMGMLLCGVLTMRLIGPAPLRAEDEAFAATIINVHRQLDTGYVDTVDNRALQIGAIQGMLEPLGDQHTMYFPPAQREQYHQVIDGQYYGIGVFIRMNEAGELSVQSPLEGSPALAAGIEAGDIITHAQGQVLKGLPMDEAQKLIKGPEGTLARLTLRSPGGESREVSVSRGRIDTVPVVGFKRQLDNQWQYFIDEELKVAYVRLTQFTHDTAERLDPLLRELSARGMRGLVLDLRFNGGGELQQAVEVADLFLQSGLIVRTFGRNSPEQAAYARGPGTLPDFPVAILVNEDTASASEIVAGALSDHYRLLRDDPRKAIVVGTRTFGKGSVQEPIDMGEQGIFKMTIAHWYLPGGGLVQKTDGATQWGVEPDVSVPMSEEQMGRLSRAFDVRAWFHRKQDPRPFAEADADDPQLEMAMKVLAVELRDREPPVVATQPGVGSSAATTQAAESAPVARDSALVAPAPQAGKP
jgi:carboxyl-terminal processing protease